MTTYTIRAGTNLKDDARSPYARVDILSNPDLTPNQGYQFATIPQKLTANICISEDSPFEQVNKPPMVYKTEEDKAYRSAITRELPPRSKSIEQPHNENAAPRGTRQDRLLQMKSLTQTVNDIQCVEKVKQKLARQLDDEYWAKIESEEAAATEQWLKTTQGKKKAAQLKLSETYKEQEDIREERLEREIKQNEREYEEIKRKQKEDEEKEKELQEIKKQKAIEARIAFQKQNEILLTRKAKRIEEEVAEMKRLQIQAEEIEVVNQQRKALEKGKRDEKNRIRNLMIDSQAKIFEELRQKEKEKDRIYDSEVNKRAEEERALKATRKSELLIERKGEYARLLRNQALMRTTMKDPHNLPTMAAGDEERDVQDAIRKEQRRKLLTFQMQQIQERRKREEAEKAEENKDLANAFFLGPDAF